MTGAASELLTRADRVEAACDLLAAPAERALQVEALVELFLGDQLAQASERALFNLLWVAGELSAEVDVYRALTLHHALERLVTGGLRALAAGDDRAAVAEMAWHFVFDRPDAPLASARTGEAIDALARVLSSGGRLCARAALHGLGHLRQHAQPDEVVRIDALLDAVTDPTLLEYAVEARNGELL
jgi:hypothetical protein